MLDVVTFGSATWDIFLRDDEFRSRREADSPTGEEICSPLGTKVEIDEARFFTGGGGTNSLATFLAQGLKAAYCGAVGSDPMGDEVVKEIKKMGAKDTLISRVKDKMTNFSVILSISGKDRTALVYRGASEHFPVTLTEIPPTKWFYIAPLSGKSATSFEKIVNFAHKRGIKTAVNLGKDQLNIPPDRLKKILAKTEVLILNQEEASILAGIDYSREDEIFKKIAGSYRGTFVMTKGSRGVIVFDKGVVYRAGIIKSKVVDRTGAGDSFGSAFISGIILGKSIDESIQLAAANSSSCLKEWGAKNGILSKGDSYRKVKVDILDFS